MEFSSEELEDDPAKTAQALKDTLRASAQNAAAKMHETGAVSTAPEELTATVDAAVTAVLTVAPPPPPPRMRMIHMPTSAARFTPPVGVQPGNDSFYPAADATARGILSVVGGTNDIVVVPSFFELQPGNPAITLKDNEKVVFYHAAIDNCASQFPSLDVAGVKRRVVTNTILVKLSCVESGQPESSGIIWHEQGHVLHGKAESGAVFGYEVEQINTHLGTETAQWWVLKKRTIDYLMRYAQGDVAPLARVLERVLSAEDYAEFTSKYAHRDDPPAPKRHVIGLGDIVRGTLEEIRAQLGRNADQSTIPAGTKKDDTIEFGKSNWQVLNIDGDGPTVYELKRLS